MMVESKLFVGLRSTRKTSAPPRESTGPQCQWDCCEKTGTHRAPVGRDAEGLYLLFCTEHVKEYNRGYNYATDLSSPNTARYQREAAAGGRKTWGTPVKQSTHVPVPSTAPSGSARALNARMTTAQRLTQPVGSPVRKLKGLEARALETLGLPANSTPHEIQSRYKQKLKMHHPDANGGSRASEEALRASIEAHKILKLNGFC
ncbi:MAG: J domain-containing protein [Rhizobium sp.]|nr:J domain-containing protein [Rhizobium sp.]MBX9455375.1 J domain-containing protein [Rhizobium sp.]